MRKQVKSALNFAENIIHDNHIAHPLSFFKTVQRWLFIHTCLLLASRSSCKLCPTGFFRGGEIKYAVCRLVKLSPAILPVGSKKKNTLH